MSGFVNTLRKHNFLNLTILGIALVFLLLFFVQKGHGPSITSQPEKKINALMMLIEFEQIDGIRQWEKELDHRGLSAIINAQGDILPKYPEDFKRLADKGYEIAGVSS